jgi:tRNA 2-thiocytidine biosynthesis protein TtcA
MSLRLDKITRLAGRAIAEFDMIHAGDRIAVGLSGGKDSTTLLQALLELQRHSPVRFELQAFTIEQGKFMGPLDGLRAHVAELNVPYRLLEDVASINLVRDAVPHGCDICSRYRRRAVYDLVEKMNCNIIAFGHTADDFAEAMLRNLLYTGAVKPLPPTAISSGGQFRIVRPLMFVSEQLIKDYAQESCLPITPCVCSLKEGARTRVRSFLRSLSAENPHIYSNLISAGVKAWRDSKSAPGLPGKDGRASASLLSILD